MSLTLAIDTSHHVAVGLARDGAPLDGLVVADTRAHGEALMPAVVELLGRHGLTLPDVTDFVVGMGPGPFTGLRVGIAAAATLAHVAGRPLHRVCSLDALAAQWVDAPAHFVVASDARRRELYWARYSADQRVGEPAVASPDALPALPVAGPVPEAHRAGLDWAAEGPVELDPAQLATHWRRLPAVGAEPLYLRAPDATVGSAPKSTIPSNQRRLRVPR